MIINSFHILPKAKDEGTLPNFYEARLILMPKPDKDAPRKENYRPVTLMNVESAMRKKEILLFAATWIKFKGSMLIEKARERQLLYDISYMWNLK